MVDVSGKGEEAGTRALLLSGAFGGLLGALPADRFLPAANDYLLRQDWAEGFATAIHLSLDLDDGSFEVRTAGHPPAALRQAGTGRWSVLPSEGPILGLMNGRGLPGRGAGRLVRHDALLLYTDGMVEEPRRDIDLGIDRMLGRGRAPAARQLRGRRAAARGRPRARATTTAPWSSFRGAEAADGRFPRSSGRVPRSRGCSSMVEPQSSKLATRVRFPSSAPSRVHGRLTAVRTRFGGA